MACIISFKYPFSLQALVAFGAATILARLSGVSGVSGVSRVSGVSWVCGVSGVSGVGFAPTVADPPDLTHFFHASPCRAQVGCTNYEHYSIDPV